MLRKVLAVLSGLVVFATPLWPAEFHAIITNVGDAPHAKAFMDVSVDTAASGGLSVDVLFDVFAADGSFLAEFAVPTNEGGFASTASAPAPYRNLFALSGDEPALVRARTPTGAGTTGIATLHQRGTGSRLLVAVPPDRRSDGANVHAGRVFAFHVGDLPGAATASLLIANISGADVGVDVFIGTPGPTGTGKYGVPALQNRNTWRVDLQPDDENANLALRATGDVIVQLVIDDGRLNAVTVLPIG